ncbi:MAG: endonuclease/exonuclease/phosphatase family protein [Chthoniobacterales bacterium]
MNRSRRPLALGLLSLLLAATLLAQSAPGPSPAAGGPAAASAVGPVLRIGFWNIKWFPGGRPNAYKGEEVRQIKSVHAEIPMLAADIIGFEEVRDRDSAALAIQPLPGFKVDVCSNFPAREGQGTTQQVAIVSRLQPMSAWAEEWKAGGPIKPPRGFAFAAYEVSPGHMLLVYAVHLKSNRGELVENIAIRAESTRQLLVHMKEMEAAYKRIGTLTWMVGGDFNTAPDDPRFQAEKSLTTLTKNGLLWAWEGIPLARRVTLPPDQRFPAACFDHIYYLGARLLKAEALLTSDVSSDHRAIRAEFLLPTAR